MPGLVPGIFVFAAELNHICGRAEPGPLICAWRIAGNARKPGAVIKY
jgi:hypothetical protein